MTPLTKRRRVSAHHYQYALTGQTLHEGHATASPHYQRLFFFERFVKQLSEHLKIISTDIEGVGLPEIDTPS